MNAELISTQATCSLHPNRPATGTCSRCGAFICDDDRRQLEKAVFCPTCAARPDVDYLEAFRLRYWGKRDGWTWLVGLGALLNIVGALPALISGNLVYGLTGVGWAGLSICFFLGLRWARIALLLTPLGVGLIGTVGAALEGNSAQNIYVGRAIVVMLIPTLMLIAVYFDTRNRLFFKIDVPREKLQKTWNIYFNNPIARWGLMLSLLGVFVPGLSLVSLGLSIAGLGRVNPDAHPPIGRKGQAIAGIILSGITIAGWVLIFGVTGASKR